jgi:hypothetical protein
MSYSEDQALNITNEKCAVVQELEGLLLQINRQGEASDNAKVREHLLHGAGRRVWVLKRCIENVFMFFPLETKLPLQRDTLSDVQINLHAFVMNLNGIYDNWAWAYVLRHNLEEKIGDRRKIGLFMTPTRKHLPEVLTSYLTGTETTMWYEKYVKPFRDALAHRIPLYIPPAELTHEEAELYRMLLNEQMECLKTKSL